MSAIVLNLQGTPEPPSQIVAGLKRVHPNLGLRYTEGHGGRSWAFTWTWPDDDARRARVRSHEIPPDAAYDILGYLPLDCPVDQAPNYAERALLNYPRQEVSRLCERMHHYNNVAVPKAQVDMLVGDTMEDFASSQRQKNPRRQRVIPSPQG